jgi:hypothetical protein
MKPENVITAEKVFAPTPSSSSLALDNGSLESYVDGEVAAKFLSMPVRRLLEYARSGRLPAHPFPDRQRNTWRFLLSELDAWMRGQVAKRKIPAAAPASQRRKSNG